MSPPALPPGSKILLKKVKVNIEALWGIFWNKARKNNVKAV